MEFSRAHDCHVMNDSRKEILIRKEKKRKGINGCGTFVGYYRTGTGVEWSGLEWSGGTASAVGQSGGEPSAK